MVLENSATHLIVDNRLSLITAAARRLFYFETPTIPPHIDSVARAIKDNFLYLHAPKTPLTEPKAPPNSIFS